MKKIAISALLLILVTGCATPTGKPVDLSGNSADKSTVFTELHEKSRFMKPKEYDLVEIIDVDGQSFDHTEMMFGTKSHAFLLKPGAHKIKVRVRQSNGGALLQQAGEDSAAKQTIGELDTNLLPNKSYLISAKATDFVEVLFIKRPTKYQYSIQEYSGTESPKTPVDY